MSGRRSRVEEMRGRSFWHDGVVVGGVLESNGPHRKFWQAVPNRSVVLSSMGRSWPWVEQDF